MTKPIVKKCQTCKRRPKPKNEAHCYRCLYKRRKEANPLKEAYRTLKQNAHRRGKVFTISFEYFRKFAVRVKYLSKVGIYSYSYHIDRIKEELGYIEGNIQLLKNPENVKKFLRWQHDQKGKPVEFKTETEKAVPITEEWWQ